MTDEVFDQNEESAGEKKVRTQKISSQTPYTDKDFPMFKKPSLNESSSRNARKPYKYETKPHTMKMYSEEASPEEIAAYEEAAGCTTAFFLKGKKKSYLPYKYLIRHRRKVKDSTGANRTSIELSYEEALQLRKAATCKKEGAPISSQFDWLYDRLTPNNTIAVEFPTNLNEGLKVAVSDDTVGNAPVEMRYLPRMALIRVQMTDECPEGETPVEPGEIFHVPPSVQSKWLDDHQEELGEGFKAAFRLDEYEEKEGVKDGFLFSLRVPIKYDPKEWAELLKDGQGSVKKRVEKADSADKEKKTAKRKLEKPEKVEKPEKPEKAKTTSLSVPKRQKVDSAPIDVGGNVVAQLADQASRAGGKAVECTITYTVRLV